MGDAVFRDGLRVITVRSSFERLSSLWSDIRGIAHHGSITRNVDIAEACCGLVPKVSWHKAVGTFGNVNGRDAFCPHSLAKRQEVPEQLDLGQNSREGIEIVPRSVLNDGAG